jgi:mercuric ion transport protein
MKKDRKHKHSYKTRLILGAGLIAAIAATFCCMTPLILFLLGITGAWMANLNAIEPYRPYFLIASAIFVAIGFWRVYMKPRAPDCKPGGFCVMPESGRVNKIMLWVTMAIIVLVLLYPFILPIIGGNS